MEAQLVALRSEFEAEESASLKVIEIDKSSNQVFTQQKAKMSMSRKGDVDRKTTGINKNRRIH